MVQEALLPVNDVETKRRRVVFPHVKRDRVKGRTYVRKYLMIFLDDELEKYNMFYVTFEKRKIDNVEVPCIIILPKVDS